MWNLLFKVKNIDSIYTSLTKDTKIVDYMYPVDRYKKNKKINILSIHILEGEEKDKNLFSRKLKNNKKVIKFDRNEDRIVVLIAEEEKFYELLYNPELFLLKPVIIKEGYEYWNIAAWDRNILEDLINELGKWKKKLPFFELQAIEKANLNDIYFPKIIPKIPLKQKEAFQLALENGYYRFPRKADLSKLAKIMKVSTQTFHEHLRKAEAKLLPLFAKSIK
jgi:predicted DNA binding protein